MIGYGEAFAFRGRAPGALAFLPAGSNAGGGNCGIPAAPGVTECAAGGGRAAGALLGSGTGSGNGIVMP